MASTFFGLDIGTTGIYSAQAGLNTTAHNISNQETKGFSRQAIVQKAGNALRTNNSYGMLGVGSVVTDVTQERELYYDEKYWRNNATYGLYNTRDYFMTEVENYLNEIELEGFTTSFNEMYDAIQEITKNPDSLTVRTSLTNKAMAFCEYFNSLNTNMKSVQNECNFEVKNEVDRINSLAKEIATLTKQINAVEIGGQSANDLRDQRALLVDDLSSIINTEVQETHVGSVGMTTYVVRINGAVLVDTYEYKSLEVAPRDSKRNQSDVDGIYDIYWTQTKEQFIINADSCQGNLKALIEVRDGNNADNLHGGLSKAISVGDTSISIKGTNVNSTALLNIPAEGQITVGYAEYEYEGFEVKVDPDTGEFEYTFELKEPVRRDAEAGKETFVGLTVDYKGIPYYMARLNQFIRTYTEKFNDIHTSGQDLDGDDGLDFFTSINEVTGKEFSFGMIKKTDASGNDYYTFNSNTGKYYDPDTTVHSYYGLTAGNYTVNSIVYHDPAKFVSTKQISDGVAGAEIALELMELKTDNSMFNQGNPAAFLQSLVAEVGIDSATSKNFAKSQENILSSISNQRLSVSGVDSEEEGMNLIRYQSAYQYACKVISVMNEIYQKLINEMGV